MASTTGQDYGIRAGLIQKGVANDDIGYNGKTGYVTVKGADAIKAPKVYNGTSFTNEMDFNNEWDAYQKKLTQATQQAAQQPVQQQPAQQAYNPYQTNNPYDSQYNDLLKTLMSQAQNPTQVDVNQIYASPQYAAYAAQAQRGAQQGIRAAQESLGSAGFGRSTAIAERSQGIQNDANEYLNTQVLPQLIAAEQNARQQQLQNQFSVLDALMAQQGVYDNRFNNANNLAISKGQLTGNYIDPQANDIIGRILQDKQNFAAATDEGGRNAARESANANRALLAAMGIDPNLFGADVTLQQAQANQGRAGVRTLGGQQLDRDILESDRNYDRGVLESDRAYDYQVGRDTVADEQWTKEFTERVKQNGIQNALAWAQNSISQQNADTAASNAAWARDATNPDNIYKNTQIEALRKEIDGASGDMKKELEGLYSGLSSGQITPTEALAEVEGRLRNGLNSNEEATKLKSFIQSYLEGGSSTGGSKPQVPSNDLSSLSNEELLKAWETDPTGKAAGRAKFDWRSWITDPRGYKAGLTYELWKSKYGPTLGG